MAQITRLSFQEKHISLDKEYSQMTQKQTLLTALLPKRDRAQLSLQALSSPGTKYESSKKASQSLTYFLMPFLMNPISTDTKRWSTALHRHEKGDTGHWCCCEGHGLTCPGQREQALRQRVRFALLPLRWMEGQPGPVHPQTVISAVRHTCQTASCNTVLPKTTGRAKDGVHSSQRLRACSPWQAAGTWEGADGYAGAQRGRKLIEMVLRTENTAMWKNAVRGINY